MTNHFVSEISQFEVSEFIERPDTLYIIDGRDSQRLVSAMCVVLFIATAWLEYYKEFVKQKKALNTLNERYRIYGGVARAVFNEDYSEIPGDMKAALADVDAVKRVDIASKYVGEQLWETYSAQMIINLEEMFGGNPNEILRHLFEIYGHRVLSVSGKKLRCRNLEDGVSKLTLDRLDEH
ncbi:hypothetical protein HK100_009541 [Physocladia obscura]|uniref:Uncharacterized protein n=1 Tax=Physocladia obscura TaxID=109957 RepID=A0AAD5X5Z3_9FUNG|nr:hypothetical protein HK100_009541 [Physocladia obscura]